MAISTSSTARIQRFIDAFIRSEAVQYLTSERNGDFVNEPERAARIADEHEAGDDCACETHAETIQDWRDAFRNLLRNRNWEHPIDRFEAAVYAYFDAVEEFHEQAGTLYEGPR